MSTAELKHDPRRAGEVTRYHTWPRLREQSVGEHSWQVARILLAIWPDCPRELIVHAIVHDVGEVAAGDVPWPNKARDPALKAAMDSVERSAHLAMAIPWSLPPPIELEHVHRLVFKMAEYLEMWEWGLAESAMGNRRAVVVASRMHSAFDEMLRGLEQYVERIRRERGLNYGTVAARYCKIAEAARIYVRRRAAVHDEEMSMTEDA